MIIKYKTEKWRNDIQRIEIERETEKCVWIGIGRGSSKHSKVSSYDRFHDTFHDAKTHIIERLESKIDILKRALHKYSSELGMAKGLTPQQITAE